jgi:cytochrome P450
MFDLLTLESARELVYANYCFYESMRMDPPIKLTTIFEALDDVTLDGLQLMKG